MRLVHSRRTTLPVRCLARWHLLPSPPMARSLARTVDLGLRRVLVMFLTACAPAAATPTRSAVDTAGAVAPIVGAPPKEVASPDDAGGPHAAPTRPDQPMPPPDVGAPPPDATRTPDGLATKVTKPGTGKLHPQPADGVRVLYTLWRRDGRLLLMADKPRLHGVINWFEAWANTLQQMVEGEARTVWVPESLCWEFHGDVTLVVELVEIVPAPKVPTDVGAPPRDAVVEKSGLVSKVVRGGVGTAHPTPTGEVAAQWVGWTTKGTVVDSTYGQGPVDLHLASIKPRFKEVLELMVEGEVRRIWIPEALVRGSVLGTGTFVYDIELVRIGPPARR
jgi:FKBP-type peptidyl-prolyl cis-trans isomerase